MHYYYDEPRYQQNSTDADDSDQQNLSRVNEQFKIPFKFVLVVSQYSQLAVWDNWSKHFYLVQSAVD